MYSRTQLEEAGFKFTALEELVFDNPSFQELYRRGGVLDWGAITTGLVADFFLHDLKGFKPFDGEKLSPGGTGVFFDENAKLIRSVLILAAKIARDASENDNDRVLVEDLSFWLSYPRNYQRTPFRWIRFERECEDKLKRQKSDEEVAMLKQGDAEVVVLLLDKLAENVQQKVLEAVSADCIARGVFEKSEYDSDWYNFYHLPRLKCVLCDSPQRDSRGYSVDCRKNHSVVLVDCGDVPVVVKSIPNDVRRLVKPVRFKVPKSTFAEKSYVMDGRIFPNFAVYSLLMLNPKERLRFKSDLEQGLKRKQDTSHPWSDCLDQSFADTQVILPAGRQKLNALILAGPRAGARREILQESDFCSALVKENRIRADRVGRD